MQSITRRGVCFNCQENEELNCGKLDTLGEMSFLHPSFVLSIHHLSVNSFHILYILYFLACLPVVRCECSSLSLCNSLLAELIEHLLFSVWIQSQIPCLDLKRCVKHSSIESNSLCNMWSFVHVCSYVPSQHRHDCVNALYLCTLNNLSQGLFSFSFFRSNQEELRCQQAAVSPMDAPTQVTHKLQHQHSQGCHQSVRSV